MYTCQRRRMYAFPCFPMPVYRCRLCHAGPYAGCNPAGQAFGLPAPRVPLPGKGAASEIGKSNRHPRTSRGDKPCSCGKLSKERAGGLRRALVYLGEWARLSRMAPLTTRSCGAACLFRPCINISRFRTSMQVSRLFSRIGCGHLYLSPGGIDSFWLSGSPCLRTVLRQ